MAEDCVKGEVDPQHPVICLVDARTKGQVPTAGDGNARSGKDTINGVGRRRFVDSGGCVYSVLFQNYVPHAGPL